MEDFAYEKKKAVPVELDGPTEIKTRIPACSSSYADE